MKKRSHFLFVAVIAWTFAVTIARALRRPNDFAEAFWLLDYRFGFIKRGLVGAVCNTILNLFGLRMNPGIILFLSSLAFAGMVLLFFLPVCRMALRDSHVSIPILVFSTSPFLVMAAHLLGYFDALVYALAILSILLVLRNRPLLAMLLSGVAILSHESYLLLGAPLVCLAMLAKGEKVVKYACLSIPVIAFLSLSFPGADRELLSRQIAQHLDSFGFVATRSAGVGAWETKPFLAFFAEQSPSFWARVSDRSLLSLTAPSLLFFFTLIFSSFQFRNKLLSLAVPAVVLIPLSMHAIAWDTARISMYPIASAFLAWWVLTETHPQKLNELPLLLPGAVFFFHLSARVPLMDGESDRFSDAFRLLLYSPSIAFFIFETLKELCLRHGQACERPVSALYYDI